MNPDPKVLQFALAPVSGRAQQLALPLLVYNQIFPDGTPEVRADHAEKLIARHHWHPAWRWGVYDFVHFHSTAHELLVVYRGTGHLRFGGGAGVLLDVSAGDAVVIPAGGAHQNLGSSKDFHVVGAYPRGQKADLIRADSPEAGPAQERLANVPLPIEDPFFGNDGPLIKLWDPRHT